MTVKREVISTPMANVLQYYYHIYLWSFKAGEQIGGEFGAYSPPENGMKKGILCWIRLSGVYTTL